MFHTWTRSPIASSDPGSQILPSADLYRPTKLRHLTTAPLAPSHLSSAICYFIRALGENDAICHHGVIGFTPLTGLPKRSMLRREREFRRRLPADRSQSARLPLAKARCIVFVNDE